MIPLHVPVVRDLRQRPNTEPRGRGGPTLGGAHLLDDVSARADRIVEGAMAAMAFAYDRARQSGVTKLSSPANSIHPSSDAKNFGNSTKFSVRSSPRTEASSAHSARHKSYPRAPSPRAHPCDDIAISLQRGRATHRRFSAARFPSGLTSS